MQKTRTTAINNPSYGVLFIHPPFSYLPSNSFDPITHLEHFKSAITDIYFVQHFYFRFGIMGYSFFSLSSDCVYNTIRK